MAVAAAMLMAVVIPKMMNKQSDTSKSPQLNIKLYRTILPVFSCDRGMWSVLLHMSLKIDKKIPTLWRGSFLKI